MEDIMKIFKSFEKSRLLIKIIREKTKNEAKEQKGGFLPILLGTSTPSVLGNALSVRGVVRAGEGLIRADQYF